MESLSTFGETPGCERSCSSAHNGTANAQVLGMKHDCRCGAIIANTLSKQCELPISGPQSELTGNITKNILAQIDLVHRELSRKHIRDLENLSARITETRTCHCQSLTNILERFGEFRNALLTWQIRDQYLLMPTLRERVSAELSGTIFVESYSGEFADLARQAETDHSDLCRLAEGLIHEIESLKSVSNCPALVVRFTSQIVDFVKYLKLQFRLEETFLRPSTVQPQQEKMAG